MVPPSEDCSATLAIAVVLMIGSQLPASSLAFSWMSLQEQNQISLLPPLHI